MHGRVMCSGSRDVVAPRLKEISMIILLTLALSACGSNGGSSGDAAIERSNSDVVELLIDGGSFDPETLELSKDEQVTVKIVNNDSTPHDFAIESIDLHTDTIKPGDAVIATFVAREGAAEFVCTLHPDMKGRIDLTPGQ
jgi:plastocyanin